jgi:hypothetical protein
MGYYPLSSRFFGDLAHYVRSGDFVTAMIARAEDVNELAFALGALAHYSADTTGHPIAINHAVPLMFPKLAAKYGSTMTYEDAPAAHLRTEFGLDVLQVARGGYLPESYRKFIGFEVSKPLLERAFRETYGLELRDVFGDFDTAVGTFRWAVSGLLPALTKAAWSAKQQELEARQPGLMRDDVVFKYSRAEYEQAWGSSYRRPGVRHRLLAFVIRILPKIGPLKALAFKAPTPEAERLFLESFEAVVREYRGNLSHVRRGALVLPERNFDTGSRVRAGDYRLVDEAYAHLVTRLAAQHFAGVSPLLRARLLAFYDEPSGSLSVHTNAKERRRLDQDLIRLRGLRAPGALPAGGQRGTRRARPAVPAGELQRPQVSSQR